MKTTEIEAAVRAAEALRARHSDALTDPYHLTEWAREACDYLPVAIELLRQWHEQHGGPFGEEVLRAFREHILAAPKGNAVPAGAPVDVMSVNVSMLPQVQAVIVDLRLKVGGLP